MPAHLPRLQGLRLARLGLPAFAASLALASACARAGDWPQILGPARNGKATGETLVLPWAKGQQATVWSQEVGHGLAGVAVSLGRVILFHRLGNELVAERLDAATGKKRWRWTAPTTYVSTISPDDGPRCVPVIHGDRVYVLGPAGELACLNLDDGSERWARNVYQDFRAPEGYFGAGSSPIVEGDKLLLNVGGAQGAGIVALALDDGKTIWKATQEAASYSSPVAATVAGVRHLVFVTRLNVVSLDPQNGEVRFRFPFGARGPTVNAANPLVLGDHLFVSASYGVGAVCAKFDAHQASEVWAGDDVMSSQYTTCMEHGGILYGIDGRQDVGVARMRAFEPQTGKVRWTKEDFGTGNLILVGDKLLVLRTAGDLLAVRATPSGYEQLERLEMFDTTTQALPALSDGLLFARDTQTLKCVRVGQAAGDN